MKKFFFAGWVLLVFFTAFDSARLSFVAAPFYASKPVKYGLFAEEIVSMKGLHEMQARKEKFVLLDARGKSSYDQEHIAGAILPLTGRYYEKEDLFRKGLLKALPDRDADLAESMKKYPKEMPIVTYCSVDCQASAVLLLQLKRLGFINVRAMTDGFQNWQAAGYSVEPKIVR